MWYTYRPIGHWYSNNIYFYLATYQGISKTLCLDKNTNGYSSNFQLPSGPESNSYEINLYVNINDDSDGVTQYDIPLVVIVKPDQDMINNFTSSLFGSSSESVANNLIKGDLMSTTAFINTFTLMLDTQTIISNGSDIVSF